MNKVSTETRKLYTSQEMADEIGIHKTEVNSRIKELGITSESTKLVGTQHAPTYSEESFKRLRDFSYRKSVENAKILPMETKSMALQTTIEELANAGTAEASGALMIGAAKMIAALQNNANIMQRKINEQEDKIDELEISIVKLKHENEDWVDAIRANKLIPNPKKDKNGKDLFHKDFVDFALKSRGREQRQTVDSKFPFFVYHIEGIKEFYGIG